MQHLVWPCVQVLTREVKTEVLLRICEKADKKKWLGWEMRLSSFPLHLPCFPEWRCDDWRSSSHSAPGSNHEAGNHRPGWRVKQKHGKSLDSNRTRGCHISTDTSCVSWDMDCWVNTRQPVDKSHQNELDGECAQEAMRGPHRMKHKTSVLAFGLIF